MTGIIIMAACTMVLRFAGFGIARQFSKTEKARNALENSSMCLMIIFLVMQIQDAHDLAFAAALVMTISLIWGGTQLPLLAGILFVTALRNLA